MVSHNRLASSLGLLKAGGQRPKMVQLIACWCVIGSDPAGGMQYHEPIIDNID